MDLYTLLAQPAAEMLRMRTPDQARAWLAAVAARADTPGPLAPGDTAAERWRRMDPAARALIHAALDEYTAPTPLAETCGIPGHVGHPPYECWWGGGAPADGDAPG